MHDLIELIRVRDPDGMHLVTELGDSTRTLRASKEPTPRTVGNAHSLHLALLCKLRGAFFTLQIPGIYTSNGFLMAKFLVFHPLMAS